VRKNYLYARVRQQGGATRQEGGRVLRVAKKEMLDRQEEVLPWGGKIGVSTDVTKEKGIYPWAGRNR